MKLCNSVPALLVAGLVATDFPPVVVEQQMVVFSQQDPVGDIGFTLVPFPLVNVVGLTRMVAGRSPGEHTCPTSPPKSPAGSY